jgi:phosphatidylinositol kinase/protein kinase (PI-3  family)
VSPEANYNQDSFVGIVEFAPEYMLVGGINAPKKIKCLGTDGKWRPQLVKG